MRYRYIHGLGIHDQQTDDYYVTPEEILWLVNDLYRQIKENPQK